MPATPRDRPAGEGARIRTWLTAGLVVLVAVILVLAIADVVSPALVVLDLHTVVGVLSVPAAALAIRLLDTVLPRGETHHDSDR